MLDLLKTWCWNPDGDVILQMQLRPIHFEEEARPVLKPDYTTPPRVLKTRTVGPTPVDA